MSTLDQITYRARNGSTGIIYEAASSIRNQAGSDRWLRRLESWLRAGKPPGRAYLHFGTQVAAIRWYAETTSHFDWQYAVVLVGPPDALTGRYSLELPNIDRPVPHQGGGQVSLQRPAKPTDHSAIEAGARSAEAAETLTLLLAHALGGEQRVTVPWTRQAISEAVMWGLLSILEMIGDTEPLSFLTCAVPGRVPDRPGPQVCFCPDVTAAWPPDPRLRALAADLTTRFADNPDALRQALAQYEIFTPGDRAGRVRRLLNLWPRIQAGHFHTGESATVYGSFERPSSGPTPVSHAGASAPPAPDGQGRHSRKETSDQMVMCPMCLHEIGNWDTLDYWRWDPGGEKYTELPIPTGLNPIQLDHHLYGARVRCPASQGDTLIGTHYLPAEYGRFGPPAVLGFVGLTKSGKSHLLAAMVGAIVGRELERNYGISSSPLDHAWHRRFMDTWVSPLLKHGKVLPGTREGGVVEFADAFLMRHRGGPERVVALFDVAGGDLARLDETKQFLWIANGLFFVVDPERMSAQWAEDETFSNVLDVVRKRTRRGPVNAAIVLNKADMVRFTEPMDRWFRSGEGGPGSGTLSPVEFLRETADVYAYLDAENALAMADPYEVCDRATMHIASPTGGADTGEGGVYPRGVTPRRVLRPLVAMLAMTGVLTGPEAEMVGV